MALLAVGVALAAGNIDPTDRWAWGTNVGWINFAPINPGVTVDPVTGWFDGYAWGENIGWIHFRGGVGPTAYGVRLANVLPPTPVPTLTAWGLLLLAGLLAGYGLWTLRRCPLRRRSRPAPG